MILGARTPDLSTVVELTGSVVDLSAGGSGPDGNSTGSCLGGDQTSLVNVSRGKHEVGLALGILVSNNDQLKRLGGTQAITDVKFYDSLENSQKSQR